MLRREGLAAVGLIINKGYKVYYKNYKIIIKYVDILDKLKLKIMETQIMFLKKYITILFDNKH